MTTSALFSAAHAAAKKVVDTAKTYRQRFAAALKSVWAAAKQTLMTLLEKTTCIIAGPGDATGFPYSANAQSVYQSFRLAEYTARGNANAMREMGYSLREGVEGIWKEWNTPTHVLRVYPGEVNPGATDFFPAELFVK